MSLIAAFDFETYLIAPAVQIPRAVCMSWALIGCGAVGGSGLCTAADGIAWLRRAIEKGATLIGANTAFDVLVSVYNSPDPEGMLALWIEACEAGRVHDVQVRQALWEMATDTFSKRYNLGAICERLGTPTQPDKGSEWRLRYNELDGLPIEQYPEDARRYAIEDAVATAEAYVAQEALRAQGSPYFPGVDVFLNEARQVEKTIALKDLESCGLRTDAKTVFSFREILFLEHAELQTELLAAGLLRPKYHRDKEAIAALATAAGRKPKRTAKGNPSLGKKFLESVDDPRVKAYAFWPDTAQYLVDQGCASVTYHRNDQAAQARLVDAFNAQGKEFPRTAGGEPSLAGDSCRKSKDPLLTGYSKYVSLTKTLGTDFSLLEQGAVEPIHANYRPIQSTGRTSTGADEDGGRVGNVQNMPRKPGVRECYCPRPGNVFFDCDWSAVELSTFAQVCYWIFGWSNLGDMINSGTDAHSVIGAEIEGVTYDEFIARKKEERFSESRTAGKAINFGRKAMMGAARFEEYAWDSYGVDVSKIDGGAQRLIDLHDQIVAEMAPYSAWAKSHAREPHNWQTKYDLVHPWSGRLRAGLGFTDVHNYPFQGLASDLAGVALWRMFKARWGFSELGKNDPLYRCLIVLFAHDSIVGEAPVERGHEAAERCAEIMFQASVDVMPNCPSKVEPVLCTRLSKKADTLRDDSGRLIPWDPWEQCRKAAEKLPAGVDARAELTKQKWPPYVVNDVLGASRERQVA